MNEPRRLLDEGASGPERALLESALGDAPAASARRAAAIALGLGPAQVANPAGGSGCSPGLGGAGLKTVALVALGGAIAAGLAVGAETIGRPPAALSFEATARVGPGGSDLAATMTGAQGEPAPAVPLAPEAVAGELRPSALDRPARPAPPGPSQAARALGEPRPPAAPEPPGGLMVRPVEDPVPPAGLMVRPVAESPAPPATGPSLAAEVSLLDSARAALAGGDPHRALAVLERHPREFPEAALAPEAAALRIEALLAQGDHARATPLADSFFSRYPNHPLGARLRSLLSNP